MFFSKALELRPHLRNLAHIETEAQKQIEFEIDQAKTGYWRIRPFLERITSTLAEDAD